MVPFSLPTFHTNCDSRRSRRSARGSSSPAIFLRNHTVPLIGRYQFLAFEPGVIRIARPPDPWMISIARTTSMN